MKYYVLRYKDTGEVAGMDDASGGYPFRARSLSHYHFWYILKDAEEYVKAFSELKVSEFAFQIKELEEIV